MPLHPIISLDAALHTMRAERIYPNRFIRLPYILKAF
jgi:hypothetical protein